MNTQIKILLYIVFVVGIFYFLQTKYNIFEISFEKPQKGEERIEKEVEIEDVIIVNEEGKEIVVDVEVVNTDALRKQGLSGRKYLGDYQGMLFVMDFEGKHFFWMKDMFISLDIIYISSEGEILEIFTDQQPCEPDFCPTVSSMSPAVYILEVNSGFCELNRVGVGNEVLFSISSEG